MEIEFLNQEGKVTKKIFNDEIQYDLKSFNKAIIADDFNNTVCKVLAQKIDPEISKKTLIFATNDFHADLIVSKLKTSLPSIKSPFLKIFFISFSIEVCSF